MSGKRYPLSVKQQAITMFFDEGKTKAEITNLLGIRDKDRVKKWIRAYRREGQVFFDKPIGMPSAKTKANDSAHDQIEYIRRLEMENELLKKFLTELGRCLPNKQSIE